MQYLNQPHTNLLDFSTIDTEQKAYLLGLLAADGSVSVGFKNYRLTLCLHKDDIELMEKVVCLISPCSRVRVYNNMSQFSVRNKVIVEQLISHGIIPNKTLNMHLPESVPPSLLCHWIRGYMDGDGSVYDSEKNGFFVCFTGQANILDFIKGWFESIHNEYNIGRHRKLGTKSTWNLKYGGRAAIAFTKLIYEGATMFMERKHRICKKYLDQPLPKYRYKTIYHPEEDPWSEDEENLIRGNIHLTPIMLVSLLPKRTYDAIKKRRLILIDALSEDDRERMNKVSKELRIKTRSTWKPEELDLLFKSLSDRSLSKQQLLDLFPNRTWKGIKCMMVYKGLDYSILDNFRPGYWSPEEEEKLRELWETTTQPLAEMEIIFKRKGSAISAKAKSMGLPDRRKVNSGRKEFR